MGFREKAARLRLLGLDVDGVLTDGKLWFDARGEVLKSFSSQDGHGIKMLQEAGVAVAIVSGRSAAAVSQRAANLGIRQFALGVSDKVAALSGFATELGITLADCGYVGDDVVDLAVLKACGFSATVADAHRNVKRQVDYVARAPGGAGAVREICDLILTARSGAAPG
ncbi:MAG: HAD hydrolase family protein [Rhodocyclaceae bacterium]|nr:HAD hydrolase family protein [Rhodocyclaceae bacterium]MBX3666792.1 HAD hydrolase family protein [Rhodocyclaceae bacterium]